MKISTQVRYGARALIELAKTGSSKPVPIQWISSRQEISPSYLEQLLASLKKANLVKSFRGPGGGYMLALPPAKISLNDIFIALEGKTEIMGCMKSQNPACDRMEFCIMHLFWERFQDSLINFLKSVTLETIVAQEQELFARRGRPRRRRLKRRANK